MLTISNSLFYVYLLCFFLHSTHTPQLGSLYLLYVKVGRVVNAELFIVIRRKCEQQLEQTNESIFFQKKILKKYIYIDNNNNNIIIIKNCALCTYALLIFESLYSYALYIISFLFKFLELCNSRIQHEDS